MNEARVESLVLQTAQARQLVNARQLQAARAAHQGAVARGVTSNLLAHLADQLDPTARASVRKIYHQALRAESTSGSGSGTTRWEAAHEAPTGVDPNMTFMEAPPQSDSALGGTRADTTDHLATRVEPSDRGKTLPPPPVGLATTHSAKTVTQADVSDRETVASPARQSSSGGPVTVIPGYTVVGELGRGGMGVVYRATAEDDGTSVAIKVLRAGEGASQDDLSRFRTEAQAAERLEHPHIVPLLDHGETEGNPYMVLEFIEGEDLDARIEREGTVEAEDAVEIAIGIADALAYAHQQGILHRDLKPQNVLLDAEGLPLLTDFGLAKLKGEAAPTVSLTQSGMLLGTPAYMAPEQANADRHKIDERTDIYGLGATLFHMLTGQRPFAGPTLAALIMKILNHPAPKLRGLVPELDADLETIVLKCLEKEREDRYPTASSLLRDLSRWQKDLAIVAAPPTIATRAQRVVRQNPVASAAGAFACLVLLIALGIGWSSMNAQAALQARLDAMEGKDQPVDFAANSTQEPATPKLTDPKPTDPTPPPANPPANPPPNPPANPPAHAQTDPVSTADPDPAAPDPDSGDPETPVSEPSDRDPEPNPVEPSERDPEPSDRDPEPTPVEPSERDPEPNPVEPSPDPDAAPPTPEPPPTPELPPLAPAELPPPWVRDRLARLAAFKSAPAYLPDWNRGENEARGWNVPLVVVVLGPNATRLPSYLKPLDTYAVTLIAQGPHPPPKQRKPPRPRRGPPPGGGPPPPPPPPPQHHQDPNRPCPEHTTLRCADHEQVAQHVHNQGGLPFNEDTVRVAVFTPNGELRLVGAKRDGDFKLSSTALKKALAQVQDELGPPQVPFEELKSLGPRLLALDRDPGKNGRTFVKYADAPGPLGAWARFRAREACGAAVERARDRQRLAERLPELREQFGAEPGCARLLDEAERELE